MDISLHAQTPPSKVFTDRGGSKYDVAIKHTMDNPNEWFRVVSVPVEKRNSAYSTASAIRQGRLGNIPKGANIEIICRRVNDEIVLFMKCNA
tara:strand:+ start:90 stop:365 length:276 start_codon:yes stop_codon:yes gene_type:complete